MVAVYTTVYFNKNKEIKVSVLTYCGYTVSLHILILTDDHHMDSNSINIVTELQVTIKMNFYNGAMV
jgi:hypothetical protein